jgi:hypothetical protein
MDVNKHERLSNITLKRHKLKLINNTFYCCSTLHSHSGVFNNAGEDPGGHAPPLKLEKIWFFGIKSWFFTRNTPNIFVPPSARHNFLKSIPANLKSWIHPCNEYNSYPIMSVKCLLVTVKQYTLYFLDKHFHLSIFLVLMSFGV